MTEKNLWLSKSVVIIVLLSLFGWTGASAQVQDTNWSEPYRLSSLYGEASGAAMVSDDYGFVHVFWFEDGFDHQRSLIYYARYDGESWSAPADIYASWPGISINALSAAVDKEGYLHLVWSEGTSGPLMYSKAEISEASSARSWQEPIRIDVAAAHLEVAVDEEGIVHVVYLDASGDQPGLYYFYTENQGKAWTYQTWLDPDIPVSAVPSWLDMAMDDEDGIHLVWSYDDLGASSAQGRWVRYTHSLDGGKTWMEHFSVDIADDEVDELAFPNPGVVVNGEEVHLIWAGTSMTEREHRFSLDRGQTWSETELILDGLEGQAIGDGLATDSLDRVHFVGQIRWPQAIYHAVWDSGAWSDPSVVYLIRQDSQEEFAGRIHAHNVRLAVHNGNQLVMTFTTSPSEQQSVLYAMQAVMEDVPETAADPLPGVEEAEAQAQPTLTPTEQAEPTATPSDGRVENPTPGEIGAETSPTSAFLLGTFSSLILVIGIVAFRFLRLR